MTRAIFGVRGMSLSLASALLAVSMVGCSSKKLDGVYHQTGNGPATLTIKDGKAMMTIANETKTFDYKVDGNKLTVLNPQEGNMVFTINDDGSLNSELGAFQKSPG